MTSRRVLHHRALYGSSCPPSPPEGSGFGPEVVQSPNLREATDAARPSRVAEHSGPPLTERGVAPLPEVGTGAFQMR
jgi:hypothetical protein